MTGPLLSSQNSETDHIWILPHSARRPRLAVPRTHEWPPAVRSAERLRGSLVSCGPGLRPAAWPETPRVRLAALAPWLGNQFVAIGTTAAWVWGVTRRPAVPLQSSTMGRKRPPARAIAGIAVHEHALTASDIAQFGDGRVTTRTRTLCDLLRSATPLSRVDRVACRLLLLQHEGGRSSVQAALDAGARRYRRVATTRLRDL
ncbi:hypothetical protein [Leucobacter sp. NPDC077196]|uniref:hypothetical protein n=1 Tax=Leucobacter sp. NPDC077196 TaxID=3154959 RepID=UPI00341A0206